MSGVKGQLAIKIFGDDLKVVEAKGKEIVNVMRTAGGIADLGLFRAIGQPNLESTVDRARAARYGINVVDIRSCVERPQIESAGAHHASNSRSCCYFVAPCS